MNAPPSIYNVQTNNIVSSCKLQAQLSTILDSRLAQLHEEPDSTITSILYPATLPNDYLDILSIDFTAEDLATPNLSSTTNYKKKRACCNPVVRLDLYMNWIQTQLLSKTNAYNQLTATDAVFYRTIRLDTTFENVSHQDMGVLLQGSPEYWGLKGAKDSCYLASAGDNYRIQDTRALLFKLDTATSKVFTRNTDATSNPQTKNCNVYDLLTSNNTFLAATFATTFYTRFPTYTVLNSKLISLADVKSTLLLFKNWLKRIGKLRVVYKKQTTALSSEIVSTEHLISDKRIDKKYDAQVRNLNYYMNESYYTSAYTEDIGTTTSTENTTTTSFILVDEFEQISQTFESTAKGSNGACRFFTSVQNLDRSDLDAINFEMLGLDKKQIIRNEDILRAIDELFYTWYQSMATYIIEINMCHTNCHTNNYYAFVSEHGQTCTCGVLTESTSELKFRNDANGSLVSL